jgi:hypothetical protein
MQANFPGCSGLREAWRESEAVLQLWDIVRRHYPARLFIGPDLYLRKRRLATWLSYSQELVFPD